MLVAKSLTPAKLAATPQDEPSSTPVKYDNEIINTILNNIYRDAYGEEANIEFPNKAFLDELVFNEFSKNPNAQIAIEDVGKFTGKYQFSEARPTDHRRAMGQKFTIAGFKQNQVAD